MTDRPMSDPTFETRAELEVWVSERSGKVLEYYQEALEHIKRVTLAHAHLLRTDRAAFRQHERKQHD